ncbi:HNH endonuclease [candidate division KSB1 bacterium]|nr:HNH endonuclease [candidate division KSB1 bacterium]
MKEGEFKLLKIDNHITQLHCQQVLVLNASYEPINICDLKRAIVLLVTGVAISEEETPFIIRSPSVEFRIPAVIRLVTFVKIPFKRKAFSKKSVFLRDKYTCQYCGKKFEPGNLTLDHVLPKSRGGRSTWENLVTSCKTCNVRKADRTPKEAGMKLQNRKKLDSLFYLQVVRFKARGNELWKKYLFF